jgi:hypothetical protein
MERNELLNKKSDGNKILERIPIFLHNTYHPKSLPAKTIQSMLQSLLLNPKNAMPFKDLDQSIKIA